MEIKDEISFAHMISDTSNFTSVIVTLYFYNKDGNSSKISESIIAHFLATVKNYFEQKEVKLKQNKFHGWGFEEYGSLVNFFVNTIPEFHSTSDSSIIQMGVSSARPVTESWQYMREFLAAIISAAEPQKDISTNAAGSILMGYTITYKAVVPAFHTFTNPKLSSEILKQTQPLFHSATCTNFAFQENSEGLLFLAEMPREQLTKSSIIYVAIEPPGKNGMIIEKFFFHHSGIMCHLDLYLHKSSYQYLQLTGGNYQYYSSKLESLSESINRLLSDVKTMQLVGIDSILLKQNAEKLAEMMMCYGEFIRLEKSVRIQTKNFQLTLSHYLLNNDQTHKAIFEYQEKFIENQTEATSLLISRMSAIIDFAKTSLHFAEIMETKVGNERSSKIQMLLTIIGAGLAFIQIFDNDSATGLLHNLGILTNNQTTDWRGIFLTKLVVTGLLILLFSLPQMVRNLFKNKNQPTTA